MEVAQLARREAIVSSSSPDVKEQVKQAIDIVDLVGSSIGLRRQGRNYVGLCPWHDDSRPSLQVNPERQSFKCWVCNIGGDVFNFVMQMEGVSFAEALAILAERAGIPLKPQRREPAGPNAPPDKPLLYRTMAWAERQYHKCLLELPEGEPGRKYLAERQITPESIEKFKLGYCPDAWDWILRRASEKGPSPKLLEAAGIALRSAGGTGNYYDRFRGRVLFSIHDPQGRPVGLGGRVLPGQGGENAAKYVNSPETPLFSKSRLLYGLDAAREAIRRTHTAMVMEGYTDCIVAHQCGFHEAVAVLGTALGEDHIRILKRFADRILLVLDGDEAGQKRTNEVLELFVAQQVDLRIVTLPEELDPCEFLLEHGAEPFRELLESRAVDALEHAFRVATRGIDLERDIHGATQALERLIAIIAKAPRHRDDSTDETRLREEKILQRLAASFRIEEAEIRRQVSQLRRKARPPAARPAAARTPATEAVPEMIDVWQRELLELLVHKQDLWPRAMQIVSAEHFSSAACRRICEAARRLLDENREASFDALMLALDEPALKALLVDLDEQGRDKCSRIGNAEALLEDLLQAFERREALRRRPAQTVALREGQLDSAAELELLERIVREQRARQGISNPRTGEDTRSR